MPRIRAIEVVIARRGQFSKRLCGRESEPFDGLIRAIGMPTDGQFVRGKLSIHVLMEGMILISDHVVPEDQVLRRKMKIPSRQEMAAMLNWGKVARRFPRPNQPGKKRLKEVVMKDRLIS